MSLHPDAGRLFRGLCISAMLVPFCAILSACSGGAPGVQPEMPDPPDPPARPVPCAFANATCAERIGLGDGLFLPAYTTHLLTARAADVTAALIVVHGNTRDADNYFESGMQAVTSGGGTLGTTLVVAPHFQTSDDDPDSDEPFWSSAGWKRGHLSRPEGPSPRVSSYAALDRILQLLLDGSRFPAMRRVVVAGHSAGGQVVHRYAGTSGEENSARAGVGVRYVVTNPSTYLYLGPERAGEDGAFATPGAGCDDYDDWHYGLRNRPNYPDGVDTDTIRARLVRRDVRILLGDADTLSASLDVSCGANLQGANRFVRGRTLVRFMDAFDSEHAHTEMIVPGVGHSSRSMWISVVGREALFGN
ncbi:MAG: alpha/beta hydrolase [Gemmatimonadetes bacterium]|nr:alpha/beta hydrolase [Gemmatimonadota bacterium]MYE70273.1 alpha/beta hydrolase [Gemmatimonadota bacterium]MYJ69742.1 alpha/beta hydrolase [Gemmatimonadota bacterium]